MKNFKVIFDSLVFEVRYSYGHLFWDRCGQTLMDIETQCDGWFNARDKQNVGRLENPEKRMNLVYNDKAFNFSVKKPEELDNDLIIEEVKKTWKIIKANFGLEEFHRMSCRLFYLKPTKSADESEMLIKNSEFNIILPDQLKESSYDLKIRQAIVILENDGAEYRVEIKGIIRSESIDPTGLYTGRPETLSKDQREYRLLKMKQFQEYSANPMYAVMLDIDCVEFDPEELLVGEFLKKQIDIVHNDFLPILEKL